MVVAQSPLTPSHETSDQHDRSRQLDSGAWAVSFIWLGLVMLAGLAWGWFLVGIGVIVLGTQLIRQQWGLNIETFGTVVALVILAAGIWDLLAISLPLMPIMLIVLGAYLLWKTMATNAASP